MAAMAGQRLGVRMTASPECSHFRFDDLTLDLGKYQLSRGDQPIRLGKLTFELLRVLVQAAPNAVSHDELMKSVWGPDHVVSAETLSQRVTLLRRALGDHAEQPRYVEVIWGQGYRIIPAVHATRPDPGSDAKSGLTPGRTASPARVSNARAAVLAAAVLALGLTGWTLYQGDSSDLDNSRQIVRFEILPPEGHPIALRHFTRDIDISLDGTKLAYSSTGGSIVVRHLNNLEISQLSNLGPEVHSITFSPDGKLLAFLTGGTLKTASIDGGPVRMIADVGQYTDGDIDWTDAGFVLAANPRGLLRVPIEAGREAELLLTPDAGRGEKSFGSPTLLPDKRTVLFVVEPIRPGEQRRIESYDLVSATRKEIMIGGARPRYVSSGHLVIAVDGELRAMPFDIRTREIVGEPTTLATDVSVNPNGTANFAIASNGTITYLPGDFTDRGSSLVWVSRDGAEEVIPVPSMLFSYPRLSPDGSNIALDVRWPESDIWIWDTRRESLSRLTNDPAETALPVWHPSGERLAFADGRNGTLDVFTVDLRDGSATELVVGSRREMPVAYSADGRYLLYGKDQPAGHWGLMVQDLKTGEHWPLFDQDQPFLDPMFSPNGKWITYASEESGQFEVYVSSFADPNGPRWQVSRDGGVKPLWSRDGTEIFYVTLDSQLMSTTVSDDPAFELGPVAHMFDATRYVGLQIGTGARSFDQSLDGSRFLMTRPTNPDQTEVADARLVVVLNSLGPIDHQSQR
jgi:serine/threonine-protein kinase